MFFDWLAPGIEAMDCYDATRLCQFYPRQFGRRGKLTRLPIYLIYRQLLGPVSTAATPSRISLASQIQMDKESRVSTITASRVRCLQNGLAAGAQFVDSVAD